MSRKSCARYIASLAIGVAALAVPSAAAAIEPISSFGSFGSGPGQLSGPGDIAVAPDGSLYVADFSNRRVDVFSPAGEFKFAFGKGVNADSSAGADPDICTETSGCKAGGIHVAGAMGGPEGLAISGNQVYVADIGDERIDVFGLDGKFLFAFGKGVNPQPAPSNPNICTAQSQCKEAETGESAGAFLRPEGVGVDPGGDVYVADVRNNRIQVFSAKGEFKFAFGGGVNVADGSNRCTLTSGCKKGSEGVGAGEMRIPFDVKPATQDSVAVSDRGNRRIDVYSADGTFQYAFAKGVNPGDGSGVCTLACKKGEEGGLGGTMFSSAIDVDAAGNVYVADDINNRLSQFSLAGGFQRAFGEGVVDGQAVFQVCLPTTSCMAGLKGTITGAIPATLGVAVDPHCSIYVTESVAGFARIEKFGDPAIQASCPPIFSAPQPQGSPPPRPSGSPGKRAPSNDFRFGKLKLNRRKGTASLTVFIPGPGALSLTGRGLRKVQMAGSGGAVRLAIRPQGKARKKLLLVGRTRVSAKVTYTPTGGSPSLKAKALLLKKTVG